LRSYDDLVKHEGNALLFAAVEISIVSSLAGRPMHVHAEGVRGTGKTTIFRSAAGILPTIERIAECEQNCRVWTPHCPAHRDLPTSDLSGLASERIRMPFREISHSAKLGTVVGSIDLAQVMDRDKPHAALLPGTIPKSNRGILFVDEVNRLADTSPELTDVLLDVMGTRPGRVQIEEAGLPVVSMPVEISVWAASNPATSCTPRRLHSPDALDVKVYVDACQKLKEVIRELYLRSQQRCSRQPPRPTS
jgi:magnesium chelatase subunit I